jgi:hypothetical protein
MQEEKEPTPGCMHLILPLVKSWRKEKATDTVIRGVEYPPDHPVYKEGWSIAIQPRRCWCDFPFQAPGYFLVVGLTFVNFTSQKGVQVFPADRRLVVPEKNALG